MLAATPLSNLLVLNYWRCDVVCTNIWMANPFRIGFVGSIFAYLDLLSSKRRWGGLCKRRRLAAECNGGMIHLRGIGRHVGGWDFC